jgi:hypothetical protein
MKFIARSVLALALILSAAARADYVSLDLSGTSPAGASATVVDATSATQIGLYSTCSFMATVQGATGGTLDIFVQTRFKQKAAPGFFWVDTAHLTQLAAAAAQTTVAFTLTRWSPTTSAITANLNIASGTPLLAAATVVPGLLGDQLRIVYKTGAGTSAGAAQGILGTCSST